MDLENIREVKECDSSSEANDLLDTGDWRLLSVTTGMVRTPGEKVCVGVDYKSGTMFDRPAQFNRFEIPYTEALATKYVLGKPNGAT